MLTDQGKNIRIINLPPTDEIKPGYSVPVDDEVDGTKKFDLFKLTTAIDGKADASEIEGLQAEIDSKAGPEEIEALEIEIEEKASQDDLVTLSGTVDQLDEDVSEAQEDISALQTAVEDLQIIPDTSAASAGDFLSFDGTGLEWTELPDMKVLAGTDIKVEENVVSVNTNGTIANSADMSFVAGSGTYAKGIGSVAFGINTSAIAYRGAFAEGEKTYAEYDCHAEGWGTSALDSNSHAEGQSTLASARCSHTEGYGTRSLNTNSHAEGNTTTAAGYTSHAEGYETTANGDYSHAESEQTFANGRGSHAEGWGSKANGDYSHAEGSMTSAVNYGAHAEGNYTLAQTKYSHAEGYKSSVIHDSDEENGGSHAEGYQTSAYVIGSHSEGYNTYAKGEGAHSEGYKTVANANRAHAEGNNSRATGRNSHAEGYYTIANGDESHSEGNYTSAYSYQTHAEGLRTYAGATAAHSEGWDTSAMAPGTHAEGKSTYVSGTNAHAEGQYTKATGNYSHVEGAETSAFGSGGHAEGYKTYSNYEYSHAEGNGSRAEVSSSHAEGQNTVASGTASHAEGYNTKAKSSYAHAEGQNTSATSTAAHAEGSGTIAEGPFSHAEGLNTYAKGTASHATGLGTEARAFAFACGKYNVGNDDDVFTVGNGSDSSNKSTCFRVDKDGKVWFIYNGVLTDLATTVADKEDKVFVAEVNVTSYADIDAAYNAGKTIVFKYQPAPQDNPEQVYYIKNMQYIPYAGYMCGTINATNCGYFIVCDTNNGQTRWTVSSFASMPEPGGNPTNGQLLSYNSRGNVWIDSPVPSSTASDSGKVLSVDSNGTASWGNAVGFVKNVGQLTDSSQIVAYNLNNGFATLSTSQSALTIVDVVGTNEIVNFAIEITPSVNCTLTIKKKVGSGGFVDLKHSVAAGNELVAGKTYQVTAVGNCWTLAEFE